ncbi:hypothetical protein [Clavibacter sp.]|uniref:hypothetical protein n=1 Tax=Clavibacter sp. TaxID=1871044 RepID=UPI0019C62787|nr:hypothetical protein [Clavibacter sp.]MBD5381943.1 hypothetical protein [Clavibacter sp.]
MNNNINISSIETHFDSVIRKHICKRCYAGTLPSTLKAEDESMVVIDCGSVSDFDSYGKGLINLYLYAQPTNGLKNVPALSRLEKALNEALENNAFDSENYTVARNFLYQDDGYDTTYNMHFIIKAIQLIIK